jgi:hypothetical protein
MKPSEPSHVKREPVTNAIPREQDATEQKDPIDESVEESFPASDPPSFTGAAGSPSKRPTNPSPTNNRNPTQVEQRSDPCTE